MTELVFILEEPSAKAMLESLLPRLLPRGLPVRYIVFEGKSDLEKKLVRRLAGYQAPDARFVILRDQDDADCGEIKRALVEKCRQAGRKDAIVRIACRELESWYLADLAAVERALEVRGLADAQSTRALRSPDKVARPSERLAMLTGNLYQKVGSSRLIGQLLDLNNDRSPSFAAFISGLRRLVGDVAGP